MKAKKTTHSFRATDTLWKTMESAANKEGMSANEWLTIAAVTQLREGVAGGNPVDLAEVGELAKANSVDKLTAAINRTNKIFEDTRKELGITLE
tara:strand:- start:125 stop:406 length:282 start_codon:yes stop_codon:yes gene_type:complete